MKNELREDLLITREDILINMAARDAAPDGKEKPCGLPEALFRLIKRLSAEDE